MDLVKGIRAFKEILIGVIVIILFVSMLSPMQSAFTDHFKERCDVDMLLEGKRYQYDPVTFSPHQVFYPPLKVEDPEYKIPYGTPWFRCFFKDTEVALKFEVKKAWVAYQFVHEKTTPVQASIREKSVTFTEVVPGINIQYTIESDSVLEEIILYEPQRMADLVQEITFEGVTPVKKDGGIYFSNGETFLFGIPPPIMYELENKDVTCKGLHYELEVFNNTYYLRKVMDEEGLNWLSDPERVYPVVIDATTQSFADPWENSGLQPYGQYFQNLSEYVSPSTGSLTVKQTDFSLPGRGLDLAITRVYTTPAVFSTGCRAACAEEGTFVPDYEDGPYNIECPFTDVGNGWQLNFPQIGNEYIHFLDGTMYKKSSINHTGHHFTYENNILTTSSGIEYHFTTGVLTSVTDPDGNTTTFGYSGGRLTSITDTVGRVVNFSYNSKGQLIQMSYNSYTVTYSYSGEALASVTDPLGRVTSYVYDQRNNWLLTRISYPSGGYTDYTYSYYAQEAEPPDPFGCYEYRKYHVTDQAVYSPGLVNHTTYTYEGDYDSILKIVAKIFNSQNLLQVMHEHCINSNALVDQYVIKNAGGTQLRRIDYTYSARNEVIQEEVYMGLTYVYAQKYVYDSWGNMIYRENGEGEKMYYSHAHTDSEKVFRNSDGTIPEFSNQFYDCSIPSHIHNALLGFVSIQDDRVIETYCSYDSSGHLIETRQLFQESADYSMFSGVFGETGQTTFPVDLTGVNLQGDAILKITGLPTPNEITKTETHSEYKYCTWLNQGYWSGKYFCAKYVSKGPNPTTDYEKIGPFLHYPGTPGYKSYTTWVSGYNQYVKTTYAELEDKYPEQVGYNPDSDWHSITTNLENRTVYYSIPVEELVSGQNTLQFRESSSWTTKFNWELYVPRAVQSVEDVSTAFVYDAYGNLVTVTDALGNTTTFGYDTQFHTYLISITNALNHTVTATYDYTRGFLTSITDAKGNTTFFEYDILGRTTKKINADLTEKEAVYNDQNNTVTIYDELDHKTIQYYDGIGRLKKVEWYITDIVNLTETYTYNYQNRIKTVTDPGGHTYWYEYDTLGRLTKVFNPDSTFKKMQYTDITNTISVFDENQHKKEYHYDWVGQLLQVKEHTDSNYYLTQYTYDSAGHLTSVIDASGNTTLYNYDSVFGVTQVVYPDATTEEFSYDIIGNLLQRTNINGTTTFAYNAIYQLVSIQYPDQSSTTFGYDANDNRVTMTDSAGQTSYIYNCRNRLLSETRTIQGEPYRVSYTYDAASRMTSMMYPDGSVVTFEYDPLNRLTAISGYAQFTYNAGSLLASAAYSNGVVTDYQYDINDRPVTLHAAKGDTDLLEMNYQYDAVSNITQLDYNRKKGQEWVQSVETFEYDWLDRLVSAEGDYGVQSYSYDNVGNRVTINDLNCNYNNMNELLSIDDGTVFTYDECGNTLSRTDSTNTWSYTYDTKNQLIQVEENQEIVTQYQYDGDGRRIQKTEWIDELQEHQTVVYIYSGLDVIYEKNLSTNQEAIYVYSPIGRIAKKVDELRDFYHTDRLGSTRLITDESGTIVTDATYNPFGGAVVTGEEEPYLYTGKERDSIGLYYFGARYYDSELGRFITRDPLTGKIGVPDTLNRYGYCLNNPLKYVDPAGTDPQETVEEIFQRLQNVDPAAYAELQEKVDSGAITALEALEVILKLLGYDIDEAGSTDDSLVVIVEGGLVLTFEIDDTIPEWGKIDTSTSVIKINFAKSGKVADMVLTALHEVCHAVLGGKYGDQDYEHQFIYSVQYSYACALKSLGVDISHDYKKHLWVQAYENDRSFSNEIPMPNISERWFPYIDPIVG